MNHYDYMSLAMQEAKKALTSREIPIGAIIVLHDSVIAAAHNQCENRSDPTAHAEILAIKKASAILGNWRLTGCSLYVTIDVCRSSGKCSSFLDYLWCTQSAVWRN